MQVVEYSAFFTVVLTTLVTSEFTCPEDWHYYGKSCYYLPSGLAYWKFTKPACGHWGAYAAEVTSPGENEFLKTLLKDNIQDPTVQGVWIGASHNYETQAWQWGNSKQNLTFTDWDQGKSIESRYDLCLSMSPNLNYSWTSEHCDDILGMRYVCETCALQTKCFQGTCYSLDCRALDQFNLRLNCRAKGGYLAKINSQEEHDFLKQFLGGANDGVTSVYFDRLEGDWVTGNKEHQQSLGTKSCMVLSRQEGWQWSTQSCEESAPFLCERQLN